MINLKRILRISLKISLIVQSHISESFVPAGVGFSNRLCLPENFAVNSAGTTNFQMGRGRDLGAIIFTTFYRCTASIRLNNQHSGQMP